MAFQRGDLVEVLNKEEGFEGSYYPANIISKISHKEYIVQYRTLVQEEDSSAPLREVHSADKIRPKPPEIEETGFCLWQVVDAYANDGWWVGKIIGRRGSRYLVQFENSDEKNAYPLRLLRVHQHWDLKAGVWKK